MSSYPVFQFLVVVQPFLWMWLYSSTIIKPKEEALTNFTLIGMFTGLYVYMTRFSVGFYTTSILLQYIGMVLICAWIYNTRFNFKQAISLSFLTVYLNSFYWEAPLHLAEIIQYGFYPQQLYQVLRLTPIPFLWGTFKFNRGSVKTLAIGYALAAGSMLLNISNVSVYNSIILFPVTRLVCVLVLTKIVMEAEKKD